MRRRTIRATTTDTTYSAGIQNNDRLSKRRADLTVNDYRDERSDFAVAPEVPAT